jgi:hypothetical protein
VQGRYFLTLLPLSFMLLYPATHYLKKINIFSWTTASKSSTYSTIFISVRVASYSFLYFLFPLITFVCTAGVIIDRYYLINTMSPSVMIKTSSVSKIPIQIFQGESVSLTLRAPSAPYGASQLKGIDVLMATYSGTADGTVSMRVCNSKACSYSSLDVAHQKDNSYFSFPLDKPLTVYQGDDLSVTITHTDGNKPVAVWLWDKKGIAVKRVFINGKDVTGTSPRIKLMY